MLRNFFTPAEIASSPDNFFGRLQELSEAKLSLTTGSVAIQGPIGIGKSSLLARTRLEMEGYQSSSTATTVVAVGHKDILTADDLARSVLEDMIDVDEKSKKMTFKLGSLYRSQPTLSNTGSSESAFCLPGYHLSINRCLPKIREFPDSYIEL
jgi:hypothetical protein